MSEDASTPPESSDESLTRLLVVEDDAALAAYLASSLKAKGFKVELARDRASAARSFSTLLPSLVLLDLGLPPAPSTMTASASRRQ